MMTTNQEFKNAALAALKGKWAEAVLATLVVMLIFGPVMTFSSVYQTLHPEILTAGGLLGFFSISAGSCLVSILVLLPLAVGVYNAFNALYVSSNPNVLSNSFGFGFRIYGRAVAGMLLVGIFTVLWSLLLVVPGIVKAYSYSLTPYILVDDPDISVREAIRKSQRLMQGQKFNLFWLELSFIGWHILCILTCGIGYLWFYPYYMTAHAAFYQNLRNSRTDLA